MHLPSSPAVRCTSSPIWFSAGSPARGSTSEMSAPTEKCAREATLAQWQAFQKAIVQIQFFNREMVEDWWVCHCQWVYVPLSVGTEGSRAAVIYRRTVEDLSSGYLSSCFQTVNIQISCDFFSTEPLKWAQELRFPVFLSPSIMSQLNL